MGGSSCAITMRRRHPIAISESARCRTTSKIDHLPGASGRCSSSSLNPATAARRSLASFACTTSGSRSPSSARIERTYADAPCGARPAGLLSGDTLMGPPLGAREDVADDTTPARVLDRDAVERRSAGRTWPLTSWLARLALEQAFVLVERGILALPHATDDVERCLDARARRLVVVAHLVM